MSDDSDSVRTGQVNLAKLILRISSSPTPHQIMDSIASLIASGLLRENDRLPTVRQLAKDLSVSPATVSTAYHSLVRVGSVVTRGRSGTTVLAQTGEWLSTRQRQMSSKTVKRTSLDLSQGTPDPSLLPDIRPFFTQLGARKAFVNSYSGPTIIAPLENVLRRSWPYHPDGITMVSGASDGVSRTLDAVIVPSDFVLVEDPTFPPFLDMIEARGGVIVGVPIDEFGMTPTGLDEAIDRVAALSNLHRDQAGKISAMIVQPRAQNPTGASYCQTRIDQLVAILRNRFPDVARFPLIIEDDSSGAIANAPEVTFASRAPERVVHVLSFSKSHGPDLRLAALSGTSEMMEKIVARRALGPGWVSRFLQELLFEMLTDRHVVREIMHSRHVYALRQRALSSLLRQHGMDIRPGDGINLWVPVHNESMALEFLAEQGIRVAPGAPFHPEPFGVPDSDRLALDTFGSTQGYGIRITVDCDETCYGMVAKAVSRAASLQ